MPQFFKNIVLYLFVCLHVCVYARVRTRVRVNMLWCTQRVSGDCTQVVRLSDKPLYPMNHLDGPLCLDIKLTPGLGSVPVSAAASSFLNWFVLLPGFHFPYLFCLDLRALGRLQAPPPRAGRGASRLLFPNIREALPSWRAPSMTKVPKTDYVAMRAPAYPLIFLKISIASLLWW